MSHAAYLDPDQLYCALSLRDVADPPQGGHVIHVLPDSVVAHLQSEWDSTLRYVRGSPVVPVRGNYGRLGYVPDGATRASRYTRYISPP